MRKKRLALAMILLALPVLVAGFLTAPQSSLFSSSVFVAHPIPFKATQLLMDIGVVDANDDGFLDVFTCNHNYRQDLLIADGKGGYHDSLSAWGLDQSPEFPGLEIARTRPDVDKPGVYIYWSGRKWLAVRSHQIRKIGRFQGTLRTYTQVRRYEGAAYRVKTSVPSQTTEDKLSETVMELATEKDGLLELEIVSPGVPIHFRLDGSIPLTQVYIGSQKVSPRSKEFELPLQDRHGMAWVDYNDDARMDVFITRGAIGGTLKKFPESVSSKIKDEFFVSQDGAQYKNLLSELGIEKDECSGRQAKWVDFNRDGLLDLFINCQDRGHAEGKYPKQLYRQSSTKRFVDVAEKVGLDVPDREVIDFVWFDADNDGDADILTHEYQGFFLYRNRGGKFFRESLGRGKFARSDNPNLKGTTDEYWFVDGKLAVADYDGDGDLDVFSASKKGNVLLVNEGRGQFSLLVDPGEVGLPAESATASWVDYDNDGLIDLYSVPEGLFRQRSNHRFEATGLLRLPGRKYMAAIVNWPDLDNDGRRDILIALLENFSFWSWWEKLYKTSEDRFAWTLAAFRNVGKGNHWLQVRLIGKPGNRQAIGARVTIQTLDGQQVQEVGLNDSAFFSQGHYRLYFGLGGYSRVDKITIRWPDGDVQKLNDVEADRLLLIEQEAAVPRGREGAQ